MNCRGSRYSSPRLTPQCRQDAVADPSQCVGPSTVPISCPRITESPALSGEVAGSKLSRKPLSTAMVTTDLLTTTPEKVTTAEAGASTVEPWAAAKSTPRCPANHGWAGGSKARTTNGFPTRGQPQARLAGRGAADVVLDRGLIEAAQMTGADPGKKTSPNNTLNTSGKRLKTRFIFLACAEVGLPARGVRPNVEGAP